MQKLNRPRQLFAILFGAQLFLRSMHPSAAPNGPIRGAAGPDTILTVPYRTVPYPTGFVWSPREGGGLSSHRHPSLTPQHDGCGRLLDGVWFV